MSGIQCQSCAGRAQLYLCGQCQGELRELLQSLISRRDDDGKHRLGLLEYLDDCAHGQTNMGETGARVRTDESPIRFNAKASTLVTRARATLARWCQDVCEPRGIIFAPLRSTEPDFVGPLMPRWWRLPAGYIATAGDMAAWLAEYVPAIACDDGAGICLHEIRALVSEIERAINRPIPPRFCGVCDTEVDRKQCGLALYARREAIEITCPKCRTTHNVERLLTRTINVAEHLRFTREELIGSQRGESPDRYTTGIMGELDEFVHYKKFQRWVKDSKLRASGYRSANGRIGINRHTDVDTPLYRLSEVRKLRRSRDEVEAKAG